ncbi:transglutaminase domain-containing protein [uncultured Algibacter sp.]|uniref:transglutaminase domain-containing protein n=1 Tax=uncultured Algibacter sp. TaxID=298659 RepID=UPI0026268F5D|nr:transglutaminase domain-containing protein [uncultured Algibacter sp.]
MKQLLIVFIIFLNLFVNAQKSDFKHIDFEKADSIAKIYKGATLKNMPILAYNLTNSLESQVEKFRAIYIWVCSNIKSDHSFGELTLRKRKKFKNDSIAFYQWNSEARSRVFKTLWQEQKTICTGYAYLIKELSAFVDINCEIIDGYCRTSKRNVEKIDVPNHSWNAVKLDDKWYLVDATMASGYFDLDRNRFVKNYNDGYFLADPDLFIIKYYPLVEKWRLRRDKVSLKEFVSAPITYGSTFKYGIIPMTPKNLKTTVLVGEALMFKFKITSNNASEEMRLIISSGLSRKTIKVSALDYRNGSIELKYHFIKKGNYNIHFMVNSDIVASYAVHAEKLRKQKHLAQN